MKKTGTTWPLSVLFWILCLAVVTFYVKSASERGEGIRLPGMILSELCREAEKTVAPSLEYWNAMGPPREAEETVRFLVPSLGIYADGQSRQSIAKTKWQLAEAENARAREDAWQEEAAWEDALQEDASQADAAREESSLRELEEGELKTEQDESCGDEEPSLETMADDLTLFRPVKMQTISFELMEPYATLVKNFYVIDSTTMADETLLNPKAFLDRDLHVDKTGEGPQILIYHTHSQEAFLDSKPGDPSETVVGVGEKLARILEEQYGYQVLHHVESYDLPSRNGAYSRALPEIQKLLEEYPTIQVVIDLHRDEMPENVHLVTEVDGKKTARFMFFNGISRTKKTGIIDYLENEYLSDNLAFSFQMEKAAQEYYPNLTRKIYLKGYRYNMHVCPKTLLIELGAQNNTLEEAMNACEPLAALLDLVLSGEAAGMADDAESP